MRYDVARVLVACLALLISTCSGQVAQCGDCNLDGPVSIVDALTAAQLAAGMGSPSAAQLCVCDTNTDLSITVLDALMMAQSSAGLPVTLSCPVSSCGNAPPVITITSPLGGLFWAVIDITFDIGDPDLDPQTVTADFSTDGGLSWALATSAGSGSMITNPASGIAPAPGITFDWISQTDLPPGIFNVHFRVTTDDGQGGTDSDVTIFDVDNALPPPYCNLVTPSPGVPSNEIPFDYSVVDVLSTPVDLIVQFSDDGGGSWEQASEALAGSDGTVGLTSSPAPGTPHVFVWRSRFDGMGLAGPEWCMLEITVQNANGWGVCATAQFVVHNP